MELNEWRKLKIPVPFRLPSGLSLKVVKVSLESLAMSGQIPLVLLDEIADLAPKNGNVDIDVKEAMSRMGDFQGLLDIVVKHSIVEVMWQPATDENDAVYRSPEAAGFDLAMELDAADKVAVFNWCMEEVRALAPFRKADSGS